MHLVLGGNLGNRFVFLQKPLHDLSFEAGCIMFPHALYCILQRHLSLSEFLGPVYPFVLAHGHLLDRRSWDDQFAVFAERYRVVRYDQRGFGNSGLITKGRRILTGRISTG